MKLKVTEQVDAELQVRSATGAVRPATDEDLAALGYASRALLYERAKKMLSAAEIDFTDGPGADLDFHCLGSDPTIHSDPVGKCACSCHREPAWDSVDQEWPA